LNSIYDKLNLKPGERRVVTFVAIGVFILLNAFFVWPEFGKLGKLKQRKLDAQKLYQSYQAEIGNIPRYQKQLNELQEAGAAVSSEQQASQMQTTIRNQGALSGVEINRYDPQKQTASSAKPNQFFEEQVGTIGVVTEEKALIDFLYNLGVGGSLIRVRTMTLNPDPGRHKLVGNLSLVASYPKRAPAKAAPAAAPGGRTQTPAAPATARPAPGSTNTSGPRSVGAIRSNAAALRTNTAARTNLPTKK